jgi:hypothetical protein
MEIYMKILYQDKENTVYPNYIVVRGDILPIASIIRIRPANDVHPLELLYASHDGMEVRDLKDRGRFVNAVCYAIDYQQGNADDGIDDFDAYIYELTDEEIAERKIADERGRFKEKVRVGDVYDGKVEDIKPPNYIGIDLYSYGNGYIAKEYLASALGKMKAGDAISVEVVRISRSPNGFIAFELKPI